MIHQPGAAGAPNPGVLTQNPWIWSSSSTGVWSLEVRWHEVSPQHRVRQVSRPAGLARERLRFLGGESLPLAAAEC